jgi:hypothetical protein
VFRRRELLAGANRTVREKLRTGTLSAGGKSILRWAALLVAAWLVYYLLRGVSYRDVIVFLLACAGVWTLTGRHGLQAGLAAWVCTLGLGYRTLPVTQVLRIHPAEIMLCGVVLLALREKPHAQQRAFKTPAWVWPFAGFWVWGWATGMQGERRWDEMFAEFRNFLLLLPLGFVVVSAVPRRDGWRWALTALFGVGTWISALGCLEYFFPGIQSYFPGFISAAAARPTMEGFQRATFSFWGGAAATLVVVVCTPFAFVMWRWYRQGWERALTLGAAAIQVLGVYVGGYRSMWLALGFEFAVWAVLTHGPVWGASILASAAGGYRLLGHAAQERAHSVVKIVQGHPVDSSAITRLHRATDAWQTMWDKPLGLGWAGAGWVHSDFLQVGANLGILAGLLFAAAYGYTLARVLRQVWAQGKAHRPSQLGMSLLLSFIAVGSILAMEGVEVLPQLVLPIWFVWALAEVWLQQMKYFYRTSGKHASSIYLGSRTDVQLRSNRPGYARVGPVGR